MNARKKTRVAKPSRNTGKPRNPAAHFKVLVIGLGNPLRGDDSAGRLVAAAVKRRNHPFLKAVESFGEGSSLMDLWAHANAVIIVDAVASGVEAGMIHRFDASQQALPVRFNNSSTHSFGLGEAVELARALNQLPKHLIVFGIEGKRFAVGSKLSTEVKKAIPNVVGQVLKEAAAFQ
jgi:hydrogenase maturation protease